MSAFYSNQPESDDPSELGPPPSATNHDTSDQAKLDDPASRVYDEETSTSFPSTDESGEPIELNAPPAEDDPTPEEIERRSEQIRDRWSDRVKKKRHLRAPMKWNVPSVPVADIDFPQG